MKELPGENGTTFYVFSHLDDGGLGPPNADIYPSRKKAETVQKICLDHGYFVGPILEIEIPAPIRTRPCRLPAAPGNEDVWWRRVEEAL